MGTRRWFLVTILLVGMASRASAQSAELQVGAIGAYGPQERYRVAVGGSVGILAVRILYLGARFMHYFGTTTRLSDGSRGVSLDTNIVTADFGIQVPAGPAEILGTISLGSARFFTQTASQQERDSDREFVFAPGITVMYRVSRLIVAGDAQYYFTGTPEIEPGIRHNSLTLNLRVIMPFPINIYPIAL